MKVTVLQNQSLFDISVQVYGSIEGVFLLAKANNISITDELIAGTQLTYYDSFIIDKTVATYYKNNNIKPSTAIQNDTELTNRIFTEEFTVQFN